VLVTARNHETKNDAFEVSIYFGVFMKFLSCFLMLFMFALLSCKPLGSSDVSAIVSADGNNSTGLLPIRQKFEYGSNLPMGPAMVVQDAMRLTYGAVECYGPASAAVFNLLEDITRYSILGLKRVENKIYIPNRSYDEAIRSNGNEAIIAKARDYFKQEDGSYKTIDTSVCKLIGSHTLSVGSFVMIMSDPSISFDSKQLIWLALRGRSNQTSSVFSGTFYKFIRENLGATPMSSSGKTSKVLAGIDQQFNPCVNSSVNKIFSCDQNRNYLVKGSYKDVLKNFLVLVAKHNQSYLNALSKANGQARDSVAGLRIAALVSQSIYKSGILKNQVSGGGSAQPPSRESAKKVHPAIAVMLPQLPRIQEYFQIYIGTKPGSVLDPENPMPIQAGPYRGNTKSGFGLAAKTSSFSLAEDGVPTNSEPLLVGQIDGSAKEDLTASGDDDWWKRDATNPNSFYHEEDGVRWESNAVKRADGGWTYQDTMSRNGTPEQHQIVFQGADSLLGGAGKNTFVEYDVEKPIADASKLKPSTFSDSGGRIYTQNGEKEQWLDFRPQGNVDGRDLNAPVTITQGDPRVSGKVNIKPFVFSSSDDKNSIKYLASGKNGNFAWLMPPEKETESLPIAAKKPTTSSPPGEIRGFFPAPTSTPTSPTGPTLLPVSGTVKKETASQQVLETVGRIKEEKENIALDGIAMPERKVIEEYNLLEAQNIRLAELIKNSADPGEIKKAKEEIAATDVAVTKAIQNKDGIKNAPTNTRFGEERRRYFVELNNVIKEKEKMQKLVAENASEQRIMQQKINTEEKKLIAAKAERAALHESFGDRYRQPTFSERWNPLSGSYGADENGRIDTYTAQQRKDLNSIHTRVGILEKSLVDYERKSAKLKGDHTRAMAVVMPK